MNCILKCLLYWFSVLSANKKLRAIFFSVIFTFFLVLWLWWIFSHSFWSIKRLIFHVFYSSFFYGLVRLLSHNRNRYHNYFLGLLEHFCLLFLPKILCMIHHDLDLSYYFCNAIPQYCRKHIAGSHLFL